MLSLRCTENFNPCLSACSSFFKDAKSYAAHDWQRVVVLKKGPDGNYLKDKNQKYLEYTYLLDKHTGDLYKGGDLTDDSAQIISFKCAIISVFNPFYIYAYMSWYFSKALLRPVFAACDLIRTFHLKDGLWPTNSRQLLMRRVFSEIPQAVSQDLLNVIRAPIFGLGMQLASLYGIASPYEGRRWLAKVENLLHRGISWKLDWRMMDTPESEGFWQSTAKDIELAKVCYLAFCFQVRDNISNPRFKIIQAG